MTAQQRETRRAVGAIFSADDGNPGFPPNDLPFARCDNVAYQKF